MIWYWFAEVIIRAFELDVLSEVEKDGIIELECDENSQIDDTNLLHLCKEELEDKLDSRLQFRTDKEKTAMEQLLHSW